MEEKKLYTQEEVDLITGSVYAEAYNAGLNDNGHKPQTETGWVKADTKPEHNVGVLVFIPGEDNHITSGMWDISNEWVLLDEYRTPEEEVTYWMPLPAFPEGYTWNEIPGEMVDMLKKVAKEELSNKVSRAAGMEEDAVEFAEWLYENRWFNKEGDFWCYTFEQGTRVGSATYRKNYMKTTAQLYQLFKQQKNP